MIHNTKTKGAVKIAKDSASSWTPRNQHARDNVNVAQGPRTGNASAHDGKRARFQSAKSEGEALATMIEKAYSDRAHEYADHEFTNGGSIHDNTKESFKRKRVSAA